MFEKNSQFYKFLHLHITILHTATLSVELDHSSHGGSGRLYRSDLKFNSQDLDKITGKQTMHTVKVL